MSLPLFFLLLALACAPNPKDSASIEDPELVGAWITDALDEAALLHRQGDGPGALEAWGRAFRHFDNQLEPLMASEQVRTPIVELEYEFSLIRRELERQEEGEPGPLIEYFKNDLRGVVFVQ
ncbi:MAG: hypothetical protein HN348_17575 [Proteobacteria bacterium]|nr:hypothetical protein [Pseudomonadota bacterium]